MNNVLRIARNIMSGNSFASIDYLLKRHCWTVSDFSGNWMLYVRDGVELDIEHGSVENGYKWMVGYNGIVKGRGVEKDENEAARKADVLLRSLKIWDMKCHTW